MGGIEFPGLAQSLLGLGPAGIIIGVLIWELNGRNKKIESLYGLLAAAKEQHMTDIRKYSGDVAAALEKVTQALNANNVIQEKAVTSANLISQAVNTVSGRLEGVEDAVEKVETIAQRVETAIHGIASRGVH